MVYGNGVHILGYVLVTAWVSSFLSKFAPSKRIRLVDEADHWIFNIFKLYLELQKDINKKGHIGMEEWIFLFMFKNRTYIDCKLDIQ